MLTATKAIVCVLGFSLFMFLSSCGLTLPPKIDIAAENYYMDLKEIGPEFACPEGIKVHLVAGSLDYENTFTESGDGERLFFPEDVRVGTPATLDVWCLDSSADEGGYIKINKPLRPSSVGYIYIYMVSNASDRENCVEGTMERSPTPCVQSDSL